MKLTRRELLKWLGSAFVSVPFVGKFRASHRKPIVINDSATVMRPVSSLFAGFDPRETLALRFDGVNDDTGERVVITWTKDNSPKGVWIRNAE